MTQLQATELIECCTKAPFGRGEDTVYDDNVRNTWQLDTKQFRISNSKWQNLVQHLVNDQVKRGLGTPNEADVVPSLYKLLLYETDGHFNFHKDTEKEDGMFGTLVIQLPCIYTGGELTVTHNGREVVYGMAKNPQFDLFYSAFYADCKHSVAPVTSGYRLCLVYNLVSKSRNRNLSAAMQGNDVEKLRKIFVDWENGEYGESHVIYLLDHEYTMAGLSFNVLKGHDEEIVSLITAANRDKKLVECALALVKQVKSGSASSRYYGDDYSMEEEYDRSVGLEYCVDMDNRTCPSLCALAVEDDDIFPKVVWENIETDDESVEEATGNEGASIEKRYKLVGLVLWPQSKWFEMTLATKCKDISKLEEFVLNINNAVSSEEKQKLTSQAKQWVSLLLNKYGLVGLENSLRSIMISLNDIDLARASIIKIAKTTAISESKVDYIASILEHFGMDKFTKEISDITPSVEIIRYLSGFTDIVHTQLFEILGEAIINSRMDATDLNLLFDSFLKKEAYHLVKKLASSLHVSNIQRADEVSQVIINLGNTYSKFFDNPDLVNLLDYYIKFLGSHITPPQTPSMAFNVTINCKCASCASAQAFLRSNKERHEEKSNERNRRHVESNVRNVTSDVDFTTIRRGSPNVLVITKNLKSHRAISETIKKRETNLMKLQQLRQICPPNKKVKM